MVMIAAFQAVGPGSIPGCRKYFFYFRNDIINKSIQCKHIDNSQEHVINEYAKTEKLRTKLTKELNDLDNATKNKTLLDSFFIGIISKFFKRKKSNNKGIILIMQYVFKIYKLMKETYSKDKQDA